MTYEAKVTFTKELIATVQRDILMKMDRLPDCWDGHELRQLVADHFQVTTTPLMEKGKRRKLYENEVMTQGLV